MLEEIIKSAKEQGADRLASPIVGGFVVSWCLWNYKFIVILFSVATVSRTFQLIETVAFPTAWSILLNGVLLPTLSAAAYIFIYPYPAKFVYGFTRRRQKEIVEIRRLIEDETPLTIEDSRQLRAEVLLADYKHKDELDKINAELARAKDQLDALRSASAAPASATTEKPEPTLEPSQLALMGQLETFGGKATNELLLGRSGRSKVKTEYDLGELERLDLLHKEYDQNEGDYTYEFTHEGRRVVLAPKSGED